MDGEDPYLSSHTQHARAAIMADDEPDTYSPTKTRRETVILEAPHGEAREVEFKLYAGTTYDVLEGEDADEMIGWGAIRQSPPVIRKEAADAARS